MQSWGMALAAMEKLWPTAGSLTGVATDSIIKARAEVAQVVEHGTENAGVDSSSLSLGTTSFPVDYISFTPV